MKFIPEERLLPYLNREEQDVNSPHALIFYYPWQCSSRRVGKSRADDSGKQAGIIAQIHIAGILIKGGGSAGETSPFRACSGL